MGSSNIKQLKQEGIAARVTWNFGDEAREAAERARYVRSALSGDADTDTDTLGDALRFNEDRTIKMVERLAQLDSSPSMSGDEFRIGFRLLLSDLIHAAAAGHARQCAENGWPA